MSESDDATLRFRVAFHGPFHVARGEAADGADRTVDREIPLPASSLKGVMRAAAKNRLSIPGPLIDRVFGGTAPSPWAWSDAIVDTPTTTSMARIRMTQLGAVADGALMIGEHVWASHATFTVTTAGRFTAFELAAHRIVLRAAARDITALGGTRRRGEGWVSVTDDDPWTLENSQALLALRAPGAALVSAPATLIRAATAVAPFAQPPQWRVLRYRIVAQQRVSAGVRAEVGNDQLAHQVIPGSAVRGALATAWLRTHELTVPDQPMADLFERDLLVRQAVPAGSVLVPVSSRACKYPDPATHGAHQIHDEALEQQRAMTEGTDRPEPGHCRGGSETGKGWKTPVGLQVRTTRTALADDGTAEQGQLFSVHATRPAVCLTGEILLANDDPAVLLWLTQPRTLRLGGQRSIGGAVTWQVLDADPDDATTPAGSAEGGTTPTVVYCRSPLIAVDVFGAATTDISPTLTRAFPGVSITVHRSWVRTVPVGGWHMAADVPKPDEWAIDAGSTFLVSGLPTGASAQLRSGLGLRRSEGFGEVEMVATSDDTLRTSATPGQPDSSSPPAPAQPAIAAVHAGHATTDAGPAAATTSGAAHGDEQPSTPQPPRPVIAPGPGEGIQAVLAAVPGDKRAEVITGLIDVTMRMAQYQSSGTESIARGVAKSALRLPWARDLPGAAADAIASLLTSDEAGLIRDQLRSIRTAGTDR